MDRAELLRLADACEKAGGPNYALECEIAQAIWRGHFRDGRQKPRPKDLSVPNYTASMDAAMTLIPDNWKWAIMRKYPGRYHAGCGDWAAKPVAVSAKTPALALCAAALRALAGDDNG